jgi:hypothetical protein
MGLTIPNTKSVGAHIANYSGYEEFVPEMRISKIMPSKFWTTTRPEAIQTPYYRSLYVRSKT